MPPAPPVPDPDLAGVLDDVRSGVDTAGRQVDALVAAVGTALAADPGPAPHGAGTDGLRRSFGVLVDRLDAMLREAGDPNALRRSGSAWTRDVGGPVSRLAGVFSLHVMETDDRWTGVAADAYRSTLPAQRDALVAIRAVADEVDSTLNELATAIVKFWVSIAVACLGLVVTLAGALGSAATVVGAPTAVGLAVAGVGAMGKAIAVALSSLSDITTAVAARGAALDRRLADATAFPLGAWPRSTTILAADASVTDGDDTDWHVR